MISEIRRKIPRRFGSGFVDGERNRNYLRTDPFVWNGVGTGNPDYLLRDGDGGDGESTTYCCC